MGLCFVRFSSKEGWKKFEKLTACFLLSVCEGEREREREFDPFHFAQKKWTMAGADPWNRLKIVKSK